MEISQEFPLKNGTLRCKNRVLKAAMSEQLANAAHDPSDELLNLYQAWALGGSAISITGNVMVDRQHILAPDNVVLDEQSDLSRFREWAARGSERDTLLLMQLNHPGKQIPNFLNKHPVAPSAIPLGTGLEVAFATPRELRSDEIDAIVTAFACSAALAAQADFGGVQIHAAHGYLISQFLSPLHNQRQDHWGGSLENRQRFLIEICKAVRAAIGKHRVLAVKLNSADFMKGGFSQSESMQVIRSLEEVGVEILEISGGTYESPSMIGDGVGGRVDTVSASTRKREAYFLDFAEQVRVQTQMPLALTGGFRSTAAMNAAIASGAVDFVGVARAMALDPYMANKALKDGNYKAELKRPQTRFPYLNRMSGLDIAWYEKQIHRIGQKREPNPKLSPYLVVFDELCSAAIQSFKRRCATI